MEKLSKLLNEYLESKKKDIQQFMNITALMTQSDSKLYQTYIISKDFGFISRLVENDKIDINKTPGHYIYHYTDEDVIKEALMHLAIQDEPIEFLCSLLK